MQKKKKNLLVCIVKKKKRGGTANVWSDKIYKSPYKREIKISEGRKGEEKERTAIFKEKKFPAIVKKLTRKNANVS